MFQFTDILQFRVIYCVAIYKYLSLAHVDGPANVILEREKQLVELIRSTQEEHEDFMCKYMEVGLKNVNV